MAPGSSGPLKLMGEIIAIGKLAWRVTLRLFIPSVRRSLKNPLLVFGMKTKSNIMLESRMLCLILLTRRYLLVRIARKLLTKFRKSLRPFMLGLQSFVRRSIKYLRKNLMISKCS
jgi:hypothetical protein